MFLFVRRKEMFYSTAHSTHFIYGYMASDIWLKTTQIAREETRCRHIGYSFRLAARVLLYAPSHRPDSTFHSLYYTSRGALAGTREGGKKMICFQRCSVNELREEIGRNLITGHWLRLAFCFAVVLVNYV